MHLQVCSKRAFDGQVRRWRQALHDFDPHSHSAKVIFPRPNQSYPQTQFKAPTYWQHKLYISGLHLCCCGRVRTAGGAGKLRRSRQSLVQPWRTGMVSPNDIQSVLGILGSLRR